MKIMELLKKETVRIVNATEGTLSWNRREEVWVVESSDGTILVRTPDEDEAVSMLHWA